MHWAAGNLIASGERRACCGAGTAAFWQQVGQAGGGAVGFSHGRGGRCQMGAPPVEPVAWRDRHLRIARLVRGSLHERSGFQSERRLRA